MSAGHCWHWSYTHTHTHTNSYNSNRKSFAFCFATYYIFFFHQRLDVHSNLWKNDMCITYETHNWVCIWVCFNFCCNDAKLFSWKASGCKQFRSILQISDHNCTYMLLSVQKVLIDIFNAHWLNSLYLSLFYIHTHTHNI